MRKKGAESFEHQPWKLSYKLERQSRPSWTRHGLPALFTEFIELVKLNRQDDDLHLDLGCGNGVKTVHFALEGFKTLGIDASEEGFREARELVRNLGLEKFCKFIKANCLKLPIRRNSIHSASDILCFTHLRAEDQDRCKMQLEKVLTRGAYALMVLFSDKDEHFHGHKVSKTYTFQFDPDNPLMEGYAHYHGMVNVHFAKRDINRTFGREFDVVKALEVKHPLYPHRYLWNVILRKL